MSSTPVKHAGGRPSLYDPAKHPQLARQLCLLGSTNVQMSEIFAINTDTLNEWMKAHPEFSDAVKKGRAIADAEVVGSLYKRAMDGDVTACIFWLKNRRPDKWRDKHEYVETREAPQGPLDAELLKDASQEELEAMQRFMKKYSKTTVQ